jgi:hypothetical protein
MSQPLTRVSGVDIFQEGDDSIHYVADLSVDVDGSRESYRLDNKGLDDIHASAGYPHGDWWNVLVRDPHDRSRPFVDEDGFCVSMTSYQWTQWPAWDRRRYVDAVNVPYSVPPGIVRKLCRGVLLGCASRITNLVTHRSIDCVTADFSGNSIGEASQAAARFFDPALTARNGDDRHRYLYEFFPDKPAVVNGVTYQLIHG